jgi:hypothetical protein
MAIKRYSNKNVSVLKKLNAIEKKIDGNHNQDNLRFKMQMNYNLLAFSISFFAISLASLNYNDFALKLIALISFMGGLNIRSFYSIWAL